MRDSFISKIIFQGMPVIFKSLLNFRFSNFITILSFCLFFSLPMVAQVQPSESSLVVAPIQGPINTEFQEFGPTMTPDAKTLYFYSKRSNRGYTEIFKSERKKMGLGIFQRKWMF